MSFQDIKKIESSDFYLDLAFRKAKKFSSGLKKSLKINDELKKLREIEIQKIDFVRTFLKDEFKKIIHNFPNIDSLNEFYKELVKCTLDYVYLKKSLASLSWANEKFDYFFNFYKNKIKQDKEYLSIKNHSREFYGRISSVVKQIKKHLIYLEEARKVFKEFPVIKTSVYSVCLFGFPNVGKTTLLSRLTSSKPEINSYPFTTKSLNLGYIKEGGKTVQVIDTPGTLNRPEKMNNIELQAYLALKYVADLVVFVFDPTDEFEKQDKLLYALRKFHKPFVIYISKTDLRDEEIQESVKLIEDNYEKDFQIFIDVETLKNLILNNYNNKSV
ncbi:MAG: GTP-binding protein [Candidatus Woesearchaeota archaeon]